MQKIIENQSDPTPNGNPTIQPDGSISSSAKKVKQKSRWKIHLAEIFLGLVLYVLSFGPMYWHWYKSMYLGGDRFWVQLYAPLIWFGQGEFFGGWMQKYVEWWIL